MKAYPEHKDMQNFKAAWSLAISWMKSIFFKWSKLLKVQDLKQLLFSVSL